ncbi:MAG: hypothetical protein Q7R47_01155 [Candidatus Diapherotrites archaeon]|nr:hypothetical protein [Candidatus Diapherotrites archaeon]
MDQKTVLSALAQMRKDSTPRKFRQSVELYVNFTGLDFTKNENKVDVSVSLPHSTGKGEIKSLVFAKDSTFADAAKTKATRVVLESEISKLDKKEAAKFADEYDVILAEGAAMLTVGRLLGPMLAPKGKMPKLIPADVNAVENAVKSVKGSIRVSNKKAKTQAMVHCLVGHEQMKDDALADNIWAIYTTVVNALPGKQQNLKSLIVKLTMGPPIKIADEVKP